MDKKALLKIEKQLAKDPTTVSIENLYLIKIPDSIKNRLEQNSHSIVNLYFNGCKLTSLANFPCLPNLVRLELNDNSLKDEDMKIIAGFSNLKYLRLAGNRIRSLEAIKELGSNQNIRLLDFYMNPVAETPLFRESLFGFFTKLKYLNDQNDKGEEVSVVDSNETVSGEEDEEDDEFVVNEKFEKESGDSDKQGEDNNENQGQSNRSNSESEDENNDDGSFDENDEEEDKSEGSHSVQSVNDHNCIETSIGVAFSDIKDKSQPFQETHAKSAVTCSPTKENSPDCINISQRDGINTKYPKVQR